ncbi:MAG: endo-1,4-beta-xylanase [Prolixibacteraceae bacterium]|nr:endo-1,4-beta-xylanase [Prolixibacteraceae bacterium]
MKNLKKLLTNFFVVFSLVLLSTPVYTMVMGGYYNQQKNDSIGMLPVVIEAESGKLGSSFLVDHDGDITYITPSGSQVTNNPRDTSRVATYEVTFADSGYYNLFVRVLVGTGDYNDDSYFSAKTFGEKDATYSLDWVPVNGLAAAGFSEPDEIVDEYGSKGTQIWKWVNITKNFFPGDSIEKAFFVGSDTLTKTFQIGSREDGLFIDKLAFGKFDLYYTVNDLDSLLPGSMEWPGDSTIFYPGPPLAEGSPKFLGNLMARGDEDNFHKLWNQITPENEGKWVSIGTSHDTTQWNWGGVENLYNYAKENDLIFKFHTLVWGNQQPTWIDNYSDEEQLMYIESWIRQVGQRFPDMEFVDVVNEALPGHNPPDGQNDRANYKEALGGDGETGWDWIIKSFELARKYLPNSKLLINDYGVVDNIGATTTYIEIIQLLQERGLIDGIGIQSHRFSIQNANVETLKYNLDRMAATGLPIYPSEMDMGDNDDEAPFDDQLQLETYQRVFPVFWEHPSVAGITIWGYKMPVWQETSHLINDDGSWRPTLKWLKEYIEETPVEIKLFEDLTFYLEPECGNIGDNWDILTDSLTSNNHYVTAKDGFYSRNVVPTEQEAYITIPFSVDTAGEYAIHARVKCPTSTSNSFWLKVDDGEFNLIDGLTSTSWGWVTLINKILLESGDHTLTFSYRERKALLDKISISNSILTPEGMGTEAVNTCELPITSVENIKEADFIYNYPNPFSSATTIKFGIAQTEKVSLKVYDIYGREITTLVDEKLNKGIYDYEWDTSNSHGNKLPGGTYFYRLIYGNTVKTNKMLLK